LSESSNDVTAESSNSVITPNMIPLSNFQPRLILGVDQITPEEWEHGNTPIWVIPDDALEWGFQNRAHVYAGNNMVLPAYEQEWRDSAHYKAYVRPTKEEA
jgi:hypothetical protein